MSNYAELGQPLTRRETEVVALIAQGLINKEMAIRLGITEDTVKCHLHAVFVKTGCTNRVQLAIKYHQDLILRDF